MRKWSKRIIACVAAGLLLASVAAFASQPIDPVKQVDLSRYMGRWYVIAAIPTDYGGHAYNMVETYRRMSNGDICTSLWFHDGSPSGPIKNIHDTASVVDGSGHALWSVHVWWFIHAQYIVAWLKPDYSQVIVARDKRDHVWLMARTPTIPAADYQAMLARVKAMGYDLSGLRKVPQQWPERGSTHPSFVESCD